MTAAFAPLLIFAAFLFVRADENAANERAQTNLREFQSLKNSFDFEMETSRINKAKRTNSRTKQLPHWIELSS